MRERLLAARPPVWLVDVALGVTLAVVAEVELRNHADDGHRAGSIAMNTPLVLLPVLPLLVRRTYPRTAFLLVCAGLAGPSLFVDHTVFFWSGLLPLLITLYTVRRWSEGPLSRWCWLVVVATLLVGGLHQHGWNRLDSWSNLTFGTLCIALTTVAATFLRRTAQQRAELADALAQLAVEQAAREEAAVQAERSRIALEMHDVVAHAVSLMVLQVGAARMALEQHGEPAPDQLRAAETTGREALAELRRSLGALRDDGDRGPLEPLPGLAALEPLVSGFRAAGLDVRLDVDDLGVVPASLQLSVYRVVQESLTNVLKHAGRVPVTASVRRSPVGLVVEVSNPLGRPVSRQVPSGHGLAGMRERVAVFGGEIEAGADAAGFSVRASIPVPAAVP